MKMFTHYGFQHLISFICDLQSNIIFMSSFLYNNKKVDCEFI